MTRYSVAEAKARLSELIDRAEAGQSVVITRHGQPVVEIRQVDATQPPAAMTQSDLEALAAGRERRKAKGSPVDFLLELRDRSDV